VIEVFGYFFLIGLIVFLSTLEKNKGTLLLIISFVLPYFFLVEIYPATFQGLERLLIIFLIFLFNFSWIVLKKQFPLKA